MTNECVKQKIKFTYASPACMRTPLLAWAVFNDIAFGKNGASKLNVNNLCANQSSG